MNNYILKGKMTVICDDDKVLSEWIPNSKNRIFKITVLGDVMISTSFLVFDHSQGNGDPVLFETMVF